MRMKFTNKFAAQITLWAIAGLGGVLVLGSPCFTSTHWLLLSL